MSKQLLICGIISLGFLSTALAQTAPAAANTPAPSAGDETLVLSPFTVSTTADRGYRAGNSISATGTNTPIRDLPFQVSALTNDFISDIGASELPEILNYAPGVTRGSDGFTTGNAAVDVRNFQSYPERNGFSAPLFIDASNIERVEIVKGPASLLYGQIQPGGIVNYITKRPENTPFGTFDGQYGSYHFGRVAIDINEPVITDRVLFRFTGAMENEMQYVQPFSGHVTSVDPALTIKLNDAISLSIEYQNYARDEKPWALMRQNASIGTAAYLGPNFGSVFAGYILPDNRRFSAANPDDFRKIDSDTLEADLAIQHTKDWATRLAFDYDRYKNQDRQTSRGDVTVTLDPAILASLPQNFQAFSQLLPGLIQQHMNDATTSTNVSRRMQYFVNGYRQRTFEAETSGKVVLPFMVWRPLVGFQGFYGKNPNFVATLNSQYWGPASAYNKDWDIRNPATWHDPYDFGYTPDTYTTNANSYTQFKNNGFYSANQFSFLGDRLLVVAGARYTTVDIQQYNVVGNTQVGADVNDKRTTPQFGVGFKLAPNLMAYANYSESFIVPPGTSLLSTNGVPNRIAKPQIGKGYEAGFKFDLLNGRLSGTIDAFNITQGDYIITFKQIVNGITLNNDYQDGNTIASKGGELELNYSPLDNWQILFNASYCDTNYTAIADPTIAYLLGTHPQYSARDLANLWTRYNFTSGQKGLWVGFGVNYTGRKAEISNNPWLYLPRQTVLNATLGYDWKGTAHTSWSAKLMADNFTNTEDIPDVRVRGQPARLIGETTVHF